MPIVGERITADPAALAAGLDWARKTPILNVVMADAATRMRAADAAR